MSDLVSSLSISLSIGPEYYSVGSGKVLNLATWLRSNQLPWWNKMCGIRVNLESSLNLWINKNVNKMCESKPGKRIKHTLFGSTPPPPPPLLVRCSVRFFSTLFIYSTLGKTTNIFPASHLYKHTAVREIKEKHTELQNSGQVEQLFTKLVGSFVGSRNNLLLLDSCWPRPAHNVFVIRRGVRRNYPFTVYKQNTTLSKSPDFSTYQWYGRLFYTSNP